MQMTSTRAYLENTVMTARPEQLQLMLYDGAIRFAQTFRAGLMEKDFEKAYQGYERTSAILLELLNGLRPSAEPELCEKYSALYEFCQRRLDEASLQRDISKLDDALKVMQHLRATWLLVIEKVREARVGVVCAPVSEEEYVPLAVDA
jgi:flagellar protein FliS